MSCRPHKRRCGKQKNTSEQIYRELRQVQNITGCSTKTLDLILSRLHPFLKGCEDVELKMPRVRARKSHSSNNNCTDVPVAITTFSDRKTWKLGAHIVVMSATQTANPRRSVSLSNYFWYLLIYLFYYHIHADLLVLPPAGSTPASDSDR